MEHGRWALDTPTEWLTPQTCISDQARDLIAERAVAESIADVAGRIPPPQPRHPTKSLRFDRVPTEERLHGVNPPASCQILRKGPTPRAKRATGRRRAIHGTHAGRRRPSARKIGMGLKDELCNSIGRLGVNPIVALAGRPSGRAQVSPHRIGPVSHRRRVSADC